jgi:hypothetical protein
MAIAFRNRLGGLVKKSCFQPALLKSSRGVFGSFLLDGMVSMRSRSPCTSWGWEGRFTLWIVRPPPEIVERTLVALQRQHVVAPLVRRFGRRGRAGIGFVTILGVDRAKSL